MDRALPATTARPGRAATARRAAAGLLPLRPVLPRPVQLALRRALRPVAGSDGRSRDWPIETACTTSTTGSSGSSSRVGRRAGALDAAVADTDAWSLVLTHDVETDAGLRQLGAAA